MAQPKTRAPEPQTESDLVRESSLDDLDTRSRERLITYMNLYVAKKAEIDKLNEDLESLKLDKIEPIRLRLGLTKIESDEWYIARRPGRSSLDKAKAKLYLVNKGVSVQLVTSAFDHATSTGKAFTEIKRKRSDKGGEE